MKEVFKTMVDEDRIIFLQEMSKEKVIQEMVDLVSLSPYIRDKEELLSSLLEREDIMSTGIGFGIAVPHVKISSILDIVLAVGLHSEGVNWGTLLDSEKVKIVVLIVAPDYKTKEYLKVLAKVVKILKRKEVRQQITQNTPLHKIKALFE